MTPAEWLSDIGAACDELGYGIRRIEPGRVDVIALDKAGTQIRLQSVLYVSQPAAGDPSSDRTGAGDPRRRDAMTRRAIAAYAGAIVCIAWAVLTAWGFIHGATRRDDDVPTYREPEDGVQPWDARSVTLASGGEAKVILH